MSWPLLIVCTLYVQAGSELGCMIHPCLDPCPFSLAGNQVGPRPRPNKAGRALRDKAVDASVEWVLGTAPHEAWILLDSLRADKRQTMQEEER